jgi:hypothetical protein
VSAQQAALVFRLAERLGRTACEVEAMSAREVGGWLAHFRRTRAEQMDAADDDDDAIELHTLDRATLRGMFHH